MKFLTLLSLVALAYGQFDFECECGMFISTPVAELNVHRLPPLDLDACDASAYSTCGLQCYGEWQFIFQNGGLEFVRPGASTTLGEESCANLVSYHGINNLEPTNVHNNFRFCDSPWFWDGEISRTNLCCVDGQYPGNCTQLNSP